MSGESNRSFGGFSYQSAEFGPLTMAESVVTKIVAIAVAAVPGVRAPGVEHDGAVRIHFEDDHVVVHLDLVVAHGVRIPDLVQDVRTAVRDAVHRMTDLEVSAVHVLVTDVQVPVEEPLRGPADDRQEW